MRVRMLLVAALFCVGSSGCRILHAPKATTMNDEILSKLEATRPVELPPSSEAKTTNPTPDTVAAVAVEPSTTPAGAEHATTCALCRQHAAAGHPKDVAARPSVAPKPVSSPTPNTKAPVARRPATGSSGSADNGTGARVHTVLKGETLQKISRKYYGTTRRWMQIYEANKSVLENPDRLQVGMKLRIP